METTDPANGDLQPPAMMIEELNAGWGINTTAVREALRWIKRRRHGRVTPEELVEWDATHGRRLFPWTDSEAAGRWRLHAARLFLNTFRTQFGNMRVRAFINIHEDGEAEVTERAYVHVETIAQNQGMRAQVIRDITRRMERLAGELQMWNLTETERQILFERLRAAIGY